jgi:hypothetical protein
MTLDGAIKHCLEVVEKNEQAKKDGNLWIDTEYEDCCADHRQLAEWLTELKEARKLLTATKYKVEHEEWDMHGEHYIGDYALCPNCDKYFTNIYNGKAAPVVTFCPDCGQKIDWS